LHSLAKKLVQEENKMSAPIGKLLRSVVWRLFVILRDTFPLPEHTFPVGDDTNPLALLSVYDKTGLLPFAKSLKELGFRLLGSGGTAKLIRENGIEIE
jgi:hypothetical protein